MGAIYSQSTFAALHNSVEHLLDTYSRVQVLVFYASLRQLLRVFLKQLGPRVDVQTIRQNKGSQAPCVLLFVQPRFTYEVEPQGSMTDAGKLVVALSRGRDCVWMLSSVQMTGSKPWTSLWEATKHDIVTRQYTRVNVMQFVTVFFFHAYC